MASINVTDDKNELYNEIELVELASRVESKSNVLNKDYTLAWTDANLEMFADKQISCAELTVEVLKKLDKLVNKAYLEDIKKKYDVKGDLEDVEDNTQLIIQDEFLEMKKLKPDYGLVIKDILIGDVTNKMVFTRSHDGRVLKAAISKGAQPQENQQDKQAVSLLKKAFSKPEKEKEVSE